MVVFLSIKPGQYKTGAEDRHRTDNLLFTKQPLCHVELPRHLLKLFGACSWSRTELSRSSDGRYDRTSSTGEIKTGAGEENRTP